MAQYQNEEKTDHNYPFFEEEGLTFKTKENKTKVKRSRVRTTKKERNTE